VKQTAHPPINVPSAHLPARRLPHGGCIGHHGTTAPSVSIPPPPQQPPSLYNPLGLRCSMHIKNPASRSIKLVASNNQATQIQLQITHGGVAPRSASDACRRRPVRRPGGARPGGLGAGAGPCSAEDDHGHPDQGRAVHQVPPAAAVDAGGGADHQPAQGQVLERRAHGVRAARQRLHGAPRRHAQLPLRPAEDVAGAVPRRVHGDAGLAARDRQQPAADAGRGHRPRQVPAQHHGGRHQRQRLHRGRQRHTRRHAALRRGQARRVPGQQGAAALGALRAGAAPRAGASAGGEQEEEEGRAGRGGGCAGGGHRGGDDGVGGRAGCPGRRSWILGGGRRGSGYVVGHVTTVRMHAWVLSWLLF
jgi:hypothetical protein